MKRKLCAAVLAFFCVIARAREKVLIAPIFAYGEDGERIAQNVPVERMTLKYLREYWFEDRVAFYLLSSGGRTVTSGEDAGRIARALGYKRVLYGYVKKGEYSYRMEVKEYDVASSEVRAVFFGADDLNSYERLVWDVAKKIALYYLAAFHVIESETEFETGSPALALGVFGEYWAVANKRWREEIRPWAGGGANVDIFLPSATFCNFCFRAAGEYFYGDEKGNYVKDYTGAQGSLSGMVNFEFAGRNTASVLVGGFYGWSAMRVAEKYLPERRIEEDEWGMKFGAYYGRALGAGWSASLGVEFDKSMTSGRFDAVRIKLGAGWTLHSREHLAGVKKARMEKKLLGDSWLEGRARK